MRISPAYQLVKIIKLREVEINFVKDFLRILYGSTVSEKAAPGLCAIIISAVGIIGGVWVDVDGLGGGIKKVADGFVFENQNRPLV